MKYLSDYTEEPQTNLFNEKGVFFAFSGKQFEEQKKENVEYVSGGHGMFCPKGELNNVLTALENIQEIGIKKDIAENGINTIIKRELYNYECFYTGEITDAVESLEQYGISKEQVISTYNKERAKENL